MDWFDLLAVQWNCKSLLQHHSSKASVLRRSAFFMVQLSHPYVTTGKTIVLTIGTLVGKVMSLLFNMVEVAHRIRKRQPTPVFLPGEFHGQRNLAGYSPQRVRQRLRDSHTHTQVDRSFSSKEEASFNVMASLTICSEFGGQDHKVCHYFHLFFFPHLFAMKWWDRMPLVIAQPWEKEFHQRGWAERVKQKSLVNSGRASFLQKKELLFLQWLLVYLHHWVHSPRGRWSSGPGESVLALWKGPQKSFWTPRYKDDLNPKSFTFSFFISFIFKSKEA